MFLKFRFRLGYESQCREVSDSITWRRFCRIGLGGSVPHPTTLMKLTTRCGSVTAEGLNEQRQDQHPQTRIWLWTARVLIALEEPGSGLDKRFGPQPRQRQHTGR